MEASNSRLIGRIPRQSYFYVPLLEMRCLSLEKMELHSSASSEMITGDRSEVKRSCEVSNNLNQRGPMHYDSPLSFISQKGRGNRISVYFVHRVLKKFGRTGRHYVARDIYAEYDAVFQRFVDTYCVRH